MTKKTSGALTFHFGSLCTLRRLPAFAAPLRERRAARPPPFPSLPRGPDAVAMGHPSPPFIAKRASSLELQLLTQHCYDSAAPRCRLGCLDPQDPVMRQLLPCAHSRSKQKASGELATQS